MSDVSAIVYLSLGSNLGDRRENLRAAIRRISEHITIDAISSVYETAPVGPQGQPAFLNLCLASRTNFMPHDLLHFLQSIEWVGGRRPTYRWGPRVIDIDLLLYGDRRLAAPDLTIPHPEMTRRAFVLVPLAEIAPDLDHPLFPAGVAAAVSLLSDRDQVRCVGALDLER